MEEKTGNYKKKKEKEEVKGVVEGKFLKENLELEIHNMFRNVKKQKYSLSKQIGRQITGKRERNDNKKENRN